MLLLTGWRTPRRRQHVCIRVGRQPCSWSSLWLAKPRLATEVKERAIQGLGGIGACSTRGPGPRLSPAWRPPLGVLLLLWTALDTAGAHAWTCCWPPMRPAPLSHPIYSRGMDLDIWRWFLEALRSFSVVCGPPVLAGPDASSCFHRLCEAVWPLGAAVDFDFYGGWAVSMLKVCSSWFLLPVGFLFYLVIFCLVCSFLVHWLVLYVLPRAPRRGGRPGSPRTEQAPLLLLSIGSGAIDNLEQVPTELSSSAAARRLEHSASGWRR